ncbi:MAG: DNA cytosine methyltransferase [Candidatus Eisenbacteria bacterium]|nr:DNA cytosine methyltransferase [Candidatus Eisenbacteria bacterium]
MCITAKERLETRRSVKLPRALDFFAGAGLATEGLRLSFDVVWANDICPKKARVYLANHPREGFELSPIEKVRGSNLPEADLSWASFPCQDLSLAGKLGGIDKARSGLVWHWLRVMDEMQRRPPMVVAENVIGLLSAAKGEHYRLLHQALEKRGYRVGPIVLDAVHWVPQSRPRVFVIGIKHGPDLTGLTAPVPGWLHPASVRRACSGLNDLLWWRMPMPRPRQSNLAEILDPEAKPHEEDISDRNLELIPHEHWQKMKMAIKAGTRVFAGYKRTRTRGQTLELRFDGIAGCLRTPGGGSSRQLVVVWNNGKPHTRLLTVTETARLMGARKSYKVPGSYNDGYKAMGDGVAVPSVRFLSKHLLSSLATLVDTEEA